MEQVLIFFRFYANLRDAGGTFGKKQQYHEEDYFRKKVNFSRKKKRKKKRNMTMLCKTQCFL